jgi:hypothetical protein
MSGERSQLRRPLSADLLLKTLIPAGAVVLLVLHMLRPDWEIDAVSIGLLVVAALPWLPAFVESLELPGGVKLELRALEQRVQEQGRTIEDQQQIINELVVFSMAQHLARHLGELYDRATSQGEYLYRDNADFKRDLLFLRDHGFIESALPGQYLNVDALRDGQNLVGYVKLTPVGTFYVEQRRGRELALHRTT